MLIQLDLRRLINVIERPYSVTFCLNSLDFPRYPLESSTAIEENRNLINSHRVYRPNPRHFEFYRVYLRQPTVIDYDRQTSHWGSALNHYTVWSMAHVANSHPVAAVGYQALFTTKAEAVGTV